MEDELKETKAVLKEFEDDKCVHYGKTQESINNIDLDYMYQEGWELITVCTEHGYLPIIVFKKMSQ